MLTQQSRPSSTVSVRLTTHFNVEFSRGMGIIGPGINSSWRYVRRNEGSASNLLRLGFASKAARMPAPTVPTIRLPGST